MTTLSLITLCPKEPCSFANWNRHWRCSPFLHDATGETGVGCDCGVELVGLVCLHGKMRDVWEFRAWGWLGESWGIKYPILWG